MLFFNFENFINFVLWNNSSTLWLNITRLLISNACYIFFVGIPATLLTDASRGVAAETTEAMLARVKAAGSQVNRFKTIVSKQVLQFYRNFNII